MNDKKEIILYKIRTGEKIGDQDFPRSEAKICLWFVP